MDTEQDVDIEEQQPVGTVVVHRAALPHLPALVKRLPPAYILQNLDGKSTAKSMAEFSDGFFGLFFFFPYIQYEQYTTIDKIATKKATNRTIIGRQFDNRGDKNIEQNDDGELIDDNENLGTAI
uniref:Uncharacterized protein n=1 Tax=Romanomermis culicivorax TaxID=13658 RepID=A0A915LCX3_ROMCU